MHSKSVRMLLCLTLLFFVPTADSLADQSSASTTVVNTHVFAGLAPGPYLVGYKELFIKDYSRGWQGITSTVPYRPIILRIWYPSKSGGTPMQLGDYLAPLSVPAEVAPVLHFEREYSRQSLSQSVGNDPKRFSALMRRPVPSRRNAVAIGQVSPLVVYSLGQDDFLEENIVLANYLASYGYDVVTVPQLGTNERRMQLFIDDPNSYEAQVRDLETAMSAIPDDLRPDREKIATVGMSMGGIYALLVAMRNPQIRAVVGLDATFMSSRASYEFDQKTLPYYDPSRLHAPVLSLFRADKDNILSDITDLRQSDRTLYRFDHAVHGDFNSYPWYIFDLPAGLLGFPDELKVRSQAEALQNMQSIDRLTLAFLDANLKRNGSFDAPEIPGATLTRMERENAPTEEDLAREVMASGYDSAAAALDAAIKRYPNEEILRFKNMNRIGYEFLYTDRASLAVSIFRLNAIAHPTSSDAYESLGEGYEAVEDETSALTALRRSLELNPSNTDAQAELKKLTHAGPR